MCLSQARNLSSVVVFVHELSSVFLSLLLQIRSFVIFIELINNFFILRGCLELTLRCELIFTVKAVRYPPVNLFCNTLGCMGCCVFDLI